MVTKARSGEYIPKNPAKYKGKIPIIWRSSWELSVFSKFDSHPAILEWSSESKSIPYKHPFTGRMSRYIPDLLVTFIDKNGKRHMEMIEIKPAKEALEEAVKSKYDAASYVINKAKWDSAKQWCKRNGIVFRVLTEHEIYRNYK